MLKVLLFCLFLVIGNAWSAEGTAPDIVPPVPFQGIAVDSPLLDLGAGYEQGEFYRKYMVDGALSRAAGPRLLLLDSMNLMASPQRNTEQVSASSRSVFNTYYRVNSALKAGIGVSQTMNGLYHSGKSVWLSETDHERLSLKAEYIPLARLRLSLNSGLQLSGNRTESVDLRDAGAYSDLNGWLSSPFEGLKDYTLSVSDSRTFVRNNDFVQGLYRFGGVTRLSDKSDLALAGGYSILKDRAYFTAPYDKSDYYADLNLRYLASRAFFHLSRNTMDYPENSLNSRKGFTFSGGLNPWLSWRKLSWRGMLSYSSGSSDFAYGFPLLSSPGPADLPAAQLQLSDETLQEVLFHWRADYTWFKGYTLGFSRFQDMRRYDYAYSYFDTKGNPVKNPDTRDLLYDNDTLFIHAPARDTLTLTLSRSSRLLNFLDSSRSAQNRLGTTYQAELSHAFYSGQYAYTRNSLLLSVNEDSALYDSIVSSLTKKHPSQFFRRREFYTFTDVNCVPFFRAREDSVIVSGLFGIQEDGALVYGRTKTFVKNTVYDERAFNFRLIKVLGTLLSAGAGMDYSNTVAYTFNEFPLPSPSRGVSERLFRALFSLDDNFIQDYESVNRDFFLSLGMNYKKSSMRLELKDMQSFYRNSMIKDYLMINLNVRTTL